MEDPAAKSWHIDKRVPVALIITIMLQAAGLVMWGTRLETRVNYVEAVQISRAPQYDRIGAIEANSESYRREVTGRLDRIESKLDRVIERNGGGPPVGR